MDSEERETLEGRSRTLQALPPSELSSCLPLNSKPLYLRVTVEKGPTWVVIQGSLVTKIPTGKPLEGQGPSAFHRSF